MLPPRCCPRTRLTPPPRPPRRPPTAATQVHWNKDHALRREAAFEANTDITLAITEPATGRVESVLPVKLSARAQFSRYAVTPARGLHFGPVTYGTSTPPRTFEVTNLGEFPFTVRLFPLGDPPAGTPPSADALSMAGAPSAGRCSPAGGGAKGAKGTRAAAGGGTGGAPAPAPGGGSAAKKAAAAAGAGKGPAVSGAGATTTPTAPAAANALQLGQFTLEPAEAVVQPGGRLEVGVVFHAEGASTYSATAGISISERDFGDHPSGMPYVVAGESCIPGGWGQGDVRGQQGLHWQTSCCSEALAAAQP
jgi:hydrocephalus-inducing protein